MPAAHGSPLVCHLPASRPTPHGQIHSVPRGGRGQACGSEACTLWREPPPVWWRTEGLALTLAPAGRLALRLALNHLGFGFLMRPAGSLVRLLLSSAVA